MTRAETMATMNPERVALFAALLMLGSCATVPQTAAPQMTRPHALHSAKTLERTLQGPSSVSWVMREKGKPPQRVMWSPGVLEEVLDSSNFDLSEGMMLDLAEIVYDGSPCPEGNHYRRSSNSASILTVDHFGTVQEIEVSARKEGGWKLRLTQKSQTGKYPGLIVLGR